MNWYSRICLIVGALLMAVLYVAPIWSIDLKAPQYPEGIGMKIWLTHFTGNVESINNLNHYIGMAHIEESMFPEFAYLPAVVGVLIALGLAAGLLGKRWLTWSWLGTLLLFGAAAMVDMYIWGYEYGHNLDPAAAIKVEGMAYQPPLIGYKQLLNFEAVSLPDVGGYALAVTIFLVFVAMWLDWRTKRKDLPVLPGVRLL
jgi:copper chaperone NosL